VTVRIALLIAEPPTSPNSELRRHAHRLEEQFRATGVDCVVLNQARQALLVAGRGGSSQTPPRPDVATGIGEALVEAGPDVLHVLHAFDQQVENVFVPRDRQRETGVMVRRDLRLDTNGAQVLAHQPKSVATIPRRQLINMRNIEGCPAGYGQAYAVRDERIADG